MKQKGEKKRQMCVCVFQTLQASIRGCVEARVRLRGTCARVHHFHHCDQWDLEDGQMKTFYCDEAFFFFFFLN